MGNGKLIMFNSTHEQNILNDEFFFRETYALSYLLSSVKIAEILSHTFFAKIS